MANFENFTDNIVVSGTSNVDSVKNYSENVTVNCYSGDDVVINGEYFAKGGTNIKVYGGDGADTITNSGYHSLLDGGGGNDLIHNGYYYYEPWNVYYENSGSEQYNDLNGSSNVTINGGAGNDTVFNRGLNSIVDGGADNDNIKNYGNFTTITGNSGNDILINGEFFASGGINVKIYGEKGNDTITSSGSNSLLDGGAGNDLIHNGYYYYEPWNTYYDNSDSEKFNDTNGSSNVTINGGTGNDSIYNRGNNVIINAGTGNNYIYSSGKNVVVNVDGGVNTIEGENITVSGGKNNDTLVGNKYAQVFQYSQGGGNDVIINYSGEDTINIAQGKIDSYNFDGGDLIFYIGSGSLRLKNMTNHAVTVKDSTGTSTKIYSNGYSQQQVIKNFVQSMARTSLNTREKLDEAVKASSGFNSLQEVIDKMVADCRKANNAEIFLRDYCGIITDNEDTGAIIGWDVGGLMLKKHDDLMPENSAWIYPNSQTLSYRGLTLTLPEKNSLSAQEQLVIAGLNSWWFKNSVDLIEETYGLSFKDKPDTIPFGFENKPNEWAWAWGGPLVSVNMAYTHFDESDKSGGGLDGALVHEFTHVLQCNFDIWSYMPSYMTEGMANLTFGSDGYTTLAAAPDNLAIYLNPDNTSDYDAYGVGYMFWRYFMKQASDSYDSLGSYMWKNNSYITGTTESELLTNSGDNQTISGGNGADTITAYGKNSKIYGDTGNDYIAISKSSKNLMVYGGEGVDSIENQGLNITIDGGNGNDIIKNYSNFATIKGDSGNDIIINGEFFASGGTNLKIEGGAGNDTITSSGSYSMIDGGAGADLLYSGYYYYEPWNTYYDNSDSEKFNDKNGSTKITVKGGAGNDTVFNRGLNSIVDGDADNDNIKNYGNFTTITGNSGNDILINGEFFASGGINVKIYGEEGNDTITSSGSNSVLDGGSGNDLIHNGYYYYEPWNIYYDNSDSEQHNDKNGSSNVTINSGTGDDIIYNRGQKITYVYTVGDGNDTVYGYGDKDTIKIIDGNYTKTTNGVDVILKIGAGSITFVDAKNKTFNIETTKGSIGTETVPTETVVSGISIKNNVLNLSSKFTGAKVDLVDYKDATKVNASEVKQAVEIVGNSSANSIKGGKGADTVYGNTGNDTLLGGAGNDELYGGNDNDVLKGDTGNDSLYGGSGNDTLTGGAGNDLFIYEGGNDVITDYKTGEDKIKLNPSAITSSTVKGSDVILTTGNGTVTVKGAKDKVVTFVDDSGKTSDKIFFADTSYSPLATGLKYDSKRIVLTADKKFTGSQIDLQNYLPTVTKINVSAVTNNIKIVANDSGNSVKDGKGNDTIYGNTGNDTLLGGAGNDELYGGNDNDVLKGDAGNDSLYGGSGNDTLTGGAGNDLFIYEGGNDVITDYKTGEDKIKISSGTISKTTYKNKDVVFTIGSGTLTVKNSKGKKISVMTGSQTQTYSRTLDLLYDNNFMTDELQIDDVSEVTANNYSVGQFKYLTDNSKIGDIDTLVSATSFEKK